MWWLRTFSDRYKCHGETTKVTAVFGACSGQTRSAPHSRERGEVVERRLAHTPRTFAFVAAAASAMAEVATPVVGSQDDTAGAEVEGAEAERSLASSPAVTGPRVREEDITEIVTEGEAKAGHGFFRTSRGALRCGRCRSCSNRSLKRRCDLLEPPRHATGAPSKHRRHPPKPHGDDDANADADGDADNPHRAFATWQRRTLFEEDENADPAKAKFAWRRVTHARNSRSKMPPMRPDEPAVRTYGSSKQAAQGTGGDPDMVEELAAADDRGVAVVAPAPDLRPLGGADLLRLARAVMAAAEGRPPPTIASFVVDDSTFDGGDHDASVHGGARPRYSTLKCGVCAGCARGGRASAKDVATRRCDVYGEQTPEPRTTRRDDANVSPETSGPRVRLDTSARGTRTALIRRSVSRPRRRRPSVGSRARRAARVSRRSASC